MSLTNKKGKKMKNKKMKFNKVNSEYLQYNLWIRQDNPDVFITRMKNNTWGSRNYKVESSVDSAIVGTLKEAKEIGYEL